jgi:hypothetical protein
MVSIQYLGWLSWRRGFGSRCGRCAGRGKSERAGLGASGTTAPAITVAGAGATLDWLQVAEWAPSDTDGERPVS